jgi:hypothetical protein
LEYLKAIPEQERETAIIQALEVGVFALQRITHSQDIEFVKRKTESLLSDIRDVVSKIPGEVEIKLIDKIGCQDGQVLSPIKKLIEIVSATNMQRIDDVKDLLSKEIDPNNQTSTIGMVLGKLKDLLNPSLDCSIQKSFDSTIKEITCQDGTLTQSVKKIVGDLVDEVKRELSKLALEVRGEKVYQETIEKTTLKGTPFENEILEKLDNWKQVTGAEVEHVGPDNQSGDIMIRLPNQYSSHDGLCLVIEAKAENDGKGRKRISDILSEAMKARSANASIFVSRSCEGFAKEIGEWGEGELEHGPWVATIPEHLITAIRYIIVKQRINDLRKSMPDVDTDTIRSQIERIHTTLKKIGNINIQIGNIKHSAGAIEEEATSLRTDIQNALSAIEVKINLVGQTISEEKVAN